MNAENIFRSISTRISEYEKRLLEILINTEKKCYENAKGDGDKFAECMIKTSKKMKKEHRNVELKTSWVKNQTINCLNSNPNDIEPCKQKSLAYIEQNFETFFKNIK